VKISRIETQKRNKKRCSIFIDDIYSISLTKDLILKYNLNEGDEITDDVIRNILLEEEKEKIKQRAFKILHYRERSAQELKERLLKIGYDEQLVNEVIQDFIEDKTLDERRFAQAFVTDYTRLKPKGNRFIIQELKKKKISQEIIDEMINLRDEKSLALDFLNKKLTNLNKNDPKQRRKIIYRLLNRGFTPKIIYEILGEGD